MNRTDPSAGQAPAVRRNSRPFSAATYLSAHPLFRGLTGDALSRIAAAATIVAAPRGTLLFKNGDHCGGFHIIIYGQIKLAVGTAQGGEKVVELLGVGQSFGEAVMFLEKPYRVAAESLADSKLLYVDCSTIFAELDRDPLLARHMIANLSMRLHHLMGDLEAQVLQTGTQRLVRYLLSLIVDASAIATHIELPARKNIIASRLNLTHEHFSRILHGLADAGLLTVQGQKIAIPDLDALRSHGG